MASPTNDISIWQKLDLLPAAIQSLLGTSVAAIWAPFQGSHAPKTFKRHMLLTLMRKAFTRLSTEQVQYLTGTTETNYDAWIKSRDFKPRKVQLSNTKAFWIGDPEAKNIVLYFHGGGWAMPGTDAHFILLAGLVLSATKAGKSVAALALQYDLAPSKHYPHQLTQCIELLRYAMTDLGKTPAQIMLGGDSSGGNLIFGVLSHVLHPHPSIAPVKLSESLRGVILCSPVVCFNFDTARFRDSQIFEPAPASTLNVWVADYLWGGERDKWNEPLQAEVEWWNGLNDVVREMLMTIAANEAMADGQLAMATKIKNVHKELKVFSSQVDFHAEPAIGPSVGLEESEAARVIKSWAVERF